tara:strand:+ start:439 stop:2442 length:2004 start_codon:yes stop_codon:yes gene_type:complete
MGKYDPYFKLGPCKPLENLQWRHAWRTDAIHDRELQKDLRQAAFEDVLFWFNAFCWCFEPRSSLKVRPFCPWAHQNSVILDMDNAIDNAESHFEDTQAALDLVLDKSRGQGATWMYLMIGLRRWLRDDMFSMGLVTRTEDLVDSSRDPDTLMWKIDWMLGMLPPWMIPNDFEPRKHRSYSEHSLINPNNGATIVGYAATGDVARGGRKTVFAIDEIGGKEFIQGGKDYAVMNSTQHVANCRFLVSTFGGDTGSYFESATQAKKGDSNAIYSVLDWKDNPTQNRKLYVMSGNTIREVNHRQYGGKLTNPEKRAIRQQHVKLQRRGYKVSDVERNFWYNNQCLRPGATPRGIAQELDRNPLGAVSKVFSADIITAAKASCVPPLLQGRLIFDSETAEVREPYVAESEDGELKLWRQPSIEGKFTGSFSVGADISAGTAGDYSSNSTLSVVDKMTGEQVAEWASFRFVPGKFAYVAVAVCRWFNNADLVPEVNFAGNFVSVVLETLGYAEKLYFRKTDIVGSDEITKKPGFWLANDNAKLSLFEKLQEAIADGSYTPRSTVMLEECLEYEWKKDKIVHTSNKGNEGQGKAHGDRVIGAALSWVGSTENAVWVDSKEGDQELAEDQIPPGSMAARLKEYDELQGASGDPWEDTRIDVFGEDRIALLQDDWA